MCNLGIGQIVFSKCGRDGGRPFVIYKVEAEYIYVVDGDLRPIEKPKKKKWKHIQPTNHIDVELKNKFETNAAVLDADVRKALVAFKK